MIKVALNTICKPSSNIKWAEYDSAREFHYIDLTSVDRDTDSIIDPQIITAKNASSRAQRIIYTDDVLFATTRPTLRRKCIIPPQYNGQICSTGFCVLRPQKDKVLPKWVYYMLSADQFYDYIEPLQKGASYPAITDNEVRSFEIPLPAIAEQQRIVALLDNEFEKIDKLRSNAELNLQNAKDLFQAALKKELEPKDGWKSFLLGQVSDIARGGSPRPIKSFITEDPNGIRWIKIGDTEVGGKYISSTKERIKKEGMKSSRYVKAGDFLLSNSMSFGRPYILKVDGCIHDGWLVIREYEKTFTQDFLYYLLLSPIVAKQFEEGARGSTVRNLNTDIVSAVRVSIPLSHSEQREIVATLDSLNAKCKVLQDNYIKTIALCDDLKQALLRKAFNGEL